ncbi:MAG TPA: hypothetical protein VG714_01245 [Acidobacteriaceae bacterium]|nr:hypothetical protein [Acidobacteriaceae bacterium]
MRTTVDIPDATYKLLKSRAAAEGGTVKQLLLRGAENVLREPVKKKVRRLKEPPLNKGVPGSLHLTNEMIYDLLDLP